MFPADTVYGLACDPESEAAVDRLYALKGRPPDKPAAVMFFALEPALAALPSSARARAARSSGCCPAASRCCCPTRERRFPLACGPDPDDARPARAGRAAARAASPCPCCRAPPTRPAAPTRAGSPTCRRAIRAGADLVLDGGELPGTPSTVVDLRGYEESGAWTIVRTGSVAPEAVGTVLGP